MSDETHTKEFKDNLRRVMGPRLKAARKALGITQEEAAARMKISGEFYARVERGNALPSAPNLKKMADVLKVTADHLLGLDTSPPIAEARSPLSLRKDPKTISSIVDRTRDDPELLRLIMGLLRLCANSASGDEDGDEDQGADEPVR